MRFEHQKKLKELLERAEYIRDIKGEDFEDIMEVYSQLKYAFENFYDLSEEEIERLLERSEKRLEELTILGEKTLTPYEIVKIARHPQRFTLQDILENVYDSYVELGGEETSTLTPLLFVLRLCLSGELVMIFMCIKLWLSVMKRGAERSLEGEVAQLLGEMKRLCVICAWLKQKVYPSIFSSLLQALILLRIILVLHSRSLGIFMLCPSSKFR